MPRRNASDTSRASSSAVPGRRTVAIDAGRVAQAAAFFAAHRPNSVAAVRPVRFAFAASLMTHVIVLAFAFVAFRPARPLWLVTPPEPDRIVHLVWVE
jgi:hypothetical protein